MIPELFICHCQELCSCHDKFKEALRQRDTALQENAELKQALKQVREGTIEECLEFIERNNGERFILNGIRELKGKAS